MAWAAGRLRWQRAARQRYRKPVASHLDPYLSTFTDRKRLILQPLQPSAAGCEGVGQIACGAAHYTAYQDIKVYISAQKVVVPWFSCSHADIHRPSRWGRAPGRLSPSWRFRLFQICYHYSLM